jgi:hypothetical protein
MHASAYGYQYKTIYCTLQQLDTTVQDSQIQKIEHWPFVHIIPEKEVVCRSHKIT